MTSKLILAATALFATSGALAQTTVGPPADSTAPAPAGDAMNHDAMNHDAMAPDAAPATGETAAVTKGPNGKWMVGDRPATKEEVAAYKKASKTKPM